MSTEKKQGYITGNKRKINDAVTCDCCQENLRVKRNHIKLRDLYIEQLEEERDDLQQQVNLLTEKCTGYKKTITDARSKLNLGNDEEADDILAVLFCNKGGVR